MRTWRGWILAAVGMLLTLASWALMQAPPPSGSLSRYVPTGALLVLEAQDFSRLLSDWNGSTEKQQWLDSANYQMFSRSKLFLRLGDAQTEFATAAGFSPDMALVQSIAGTESALALYDIGDLRFLYITRLGSARALENALWKSRANFEPRKAAGRDYFVRTDTQSGRQAVFAATDEYLLLATAEEPLAQALTLLAGQAGQPVANDAWYRDAVAASQGRGELRLTLDMTTVTRTAYFRSYWIQGNVTELRQYRAGVIDLFRESGQMREQRVFLKAGEVEPQPEENTRGQAVAQLVRLVPAQSGFYRAWATPTSAEVIELLRQKVLDPSAGPLQQPNYAPQVSMDQGMAGSQAELETRIDEPPPAQSSGAFASAPLENLFAQNAVAAVLQTESSRSQIDGVFIESDAVITLLGSSDWDFAAALESLAASIGSRLSISGLGAAWAQQSIGGRTAYSMGEAAPLLVAGQGRYLMISNSQTALAAVLGRITQPPADQNVGAEFVAGLRHGAERQNYTKLMSQLDFLQGGQFSGNEQREPYFFSESIASLSQTLSRVSEVSRRVEDRGAAVTDTVVYRTGQ